jgi:integrase/recombinase XerD
MKTQLETYKTYLLNIKRSLVYYNYLIPLSEYLEEKNLTFETLTKEQLAQYFTDKTYSENAINNVIKSCRNFAKFLKLEKHSSFEIKMLEIMRKERQYITYEELLQGIKYYATYSKRGVSPQKCSAILKFCFFTSIRKSELFTLTRDKINLINCSALVLGIKDKAERLVYFPQSFVKELIDYFNSEPETKNNAFNITPAEFNYLTRKIGKYINKKVTPHTLRHSGGKYMVKKNINPITMQRIMGHNSLQTTLIYCAIDDKQAEENYHKQIG